MKRVILQLLILCVLGACSNKQREDSLYAQISELESQLDDCKNGADKLLAKMRIAFKEDLLEEAKAIHYELQSRHPETDEFKEATLIYDKAIEIENERLKEAERIIAEQKAERLKSLNKLKKNYDDISGVTWYKQPYFTHYTNSNLTSIYLGDDGSSRWLRLKMSYTGEDWIFFERAYLSYEGNTEEILFSRYDNKKTENSGGKVWEWIDVGVTKEVEMFLREFANSKDAKMRLSGKYTRTRNLSLNERRGILDVLNAYDALQNEIQ